MRDEKHGKHIRQKKKPTRKAGRQRRMLLASLVLCAGVLACLSLGALALQFGPSPLSELPLATRPSLGERGTLPPEAAVESTSVPASSAPVPSAAPTPSPTPAPTPSSAPSPSPEVPQSEAPASGEAAVFDFSQPAPETEAVEDSWFGDAVFLGDSRTDGLRLYSGIQGADFLAYKSLMVFHVTGGGGVDQRAIPLNGVGEKKTVLSWLDGEQYSAVYIMFGINELGYNNDTAFSDAFRQLIAEVRSRQPEAVIYIQSLVPIEPEKAQETNPAWWLNNDRVANYNTILQQVCAEEGAVYLNVQEALVDENGVLPKEGTTDGIHFTKSWYQKWYAYLKTHTVDPDAYAAGLAVLEESKEAQA